MNHHFDTFDLVEADESPITDEEQFSDVAAERDEAFEWTFGPDAGSLWDEFREEEAAWQETQNELAHLWNTR